MQQRYFHSLSNRKSGTSIGGKCVKFTVLIPLYVTGNLLETDDLRMVASSNLVDNVLKSWLSTYSEL